MNSTFTPKPSIGYLAVYEEGVPIEMVHLSHKHEISDMRQHLEELYRVEERGRTVEWHDLEEGREVFIYSKRAS